jgi:antitoxin ParD1/3/4
MTLRLELSPDTEAKLRDGIARRDAAEVRQVLTEAMTPLVEELLQQGGSELSDAEFEQLVDMLADRLQESLPPNAPALSEYALSREGIYAEHP